MSSTEWIDLLRGRGAELDDDQRPLHFGDAAAEARACFESAGLVFRSDSSLLRWSGSDHRSFLDGQCTGEVRPLDEGGAVRAVVTTAKGRVVDLVTLFGDGERTGMLASSGNAESLAQELTRRVVMEDCECISDPSHRHLQLFGPRASEIVASALGVEVGRESDRAQTIPHPSATVVAHGDGPGPRMDLVVNLQGAAEVCIALMDAGATPVGAEAREVVRVELGQPKLGREMGEHTNPLEAGLEGAISFQKGCYVGQEVIARLHHYKKVKRKLVGIRFAPDADPSHLDEVFWDLLRVGEVTSAVRSPRLGATVALALVKSDYTKLGTSVYSVHESEKLEGEVCELPF